MLKGSRFKSKMVQQVAVAAAMAGVFAISVAVAGALSTPKPEQLRTFIVTVPPFQFSLLPIWQPSDAGQDDESDDSIALVDPERPSRQLHMSRLHLEQQTPPAVLLLQLVKSQSEQRNVQVSPATVFQDNPKQMLGAVCSALYAPAADADSQSRPASGAAGSEHRVICVLTREGSDYCLIIIRDRVLEGESVGDIKTFNSTMLNEILKSAQLIDTPAPGESS